MIKKIKNLFYLTRDTDTEKLANEILEKKRSYLVKYLNHFKNELQSREAGEFFPIEDSITLKDKGIDKQIIFYKSAVIQYYARQEYDLWDEKLDPEMKKRADKEMKEKIGFITYNIEGKPTGKTNSVTVFKQLKQMNEFLKQIQDVCFTDNGYKFPDSKYFLALKDEKGLDSASRQVFYELMAWYKNQFKE